MRVIIVEDNALLREGLSLLLSTQGFEVAAALASAESFEEGLREHRPDAAVVDLRLPPTFRDEGVRAALAARRRRPRFPILVLSQYIERAYAAELLADGQGAVGYLLKNRVADVEEFTAALRRVAAGGLAVDPAVMAQLTGGRDEPLARLTPREREVLHRMAQGWSNGGIAAALFVSERAVHKHIGNIFVKLDLAPDLAHGHRRVLAILRFLGIDAGPGR